jgi:hypothetical protein
MCCSQSGTSECPRLRCRIGGKLICHQFMVMLCTAYFITLYDFHRIYSVEVIIFFSFEKNVWEGGAGVVCFEVLPPYSYGGTKGNHDISQNN